MTEKARRTSTVDEMVNELLPEDLDWQRLVRTYPLPALALAAAGGFLLGMRHGPGVLGALSGFVSAEISRALGDALGQEIG